MVSLQQGAKVSGGEMNENSQCTKMNEITQCVKVNGNEQCVVRFDSSLPLL